MASTSARESQRAGFVFAALGLGIVAASLYVSVSHPVSGAIGSGVVGGTLLAFAYLMRLSTSKTALALAAGAGVIEVAQGFVNPVGLLPGGIAVAATFALWLGLVYGIGLPWVNREHQTPLTDLGGAGTEGKALIVYHSLGGRFQPAVVRGLAEGLQTQGWRVHVTTASVATSTDLSAYRLLVLGVPIFAGKPARPILRFLERLGDLHRLPVLLVISGQGATEHGAAMMRERVSAANGLVLDMVEVWTERDNSERYGVRDPVTAVRHVGETLHIAS